MSTEVSQISAYLNSKGIRIPSSNEWLSACVECFKSQSSNYNLSSLQSFVYEQWLLADLNDVKAGTLPTDISNKVILSGSYAVQFNYVVNISVPFYKQLELLRRPDSQTNLEAGTENEKETGHRSLKIELTDGVTTVIGFEDNMIPCIKDIVPGSKAVLKGPIEARRGILMLKANNVNMLGGEVDTLLICNATENVLARFLKQPENDNPYKHLSKEPELFNDDDDLIIMAVQEVEPKRIKTENKPQPAKTKQSSITSFITPNPQRNNHFDIPADMFEDDFELPEDVFKIEAQSVATTRNQNTLNITSNHISQQFNKELNIENRVANLKTELAKSYNESWIPPPQKSSLEAPRPSHEKGKILFDLLDEPLNLDDFDADFEIEQVPKKRTAAELNFDEPFPPKKYPSTTKVMAKVIKVSKKLSVKDGNWSLSCIILAKGLELEMDFSSQVLEKLIGVSVEKITLMRKEVKNDIAKKYEINDMLKNKQQTIKNLNCNMTIQFLNFISNPVVIVVHDS